MFNVIASLTRKMIAVSSKNDSTRCDRVQGEEILSVFFVSCDEEKIF
jgi:hypothetical protein